MQPMRRLTVGFRNYDIPGEGGTIHKQAGSQFEIDGIEYTDRAGVLSRMEGGHWVPVAEVDSSSSGIVKK